MLGARAILALLATLLALAAPAGALQQERILSFDSVIRVNKDLGLTVTETIVVHATATKIKRGIYRELPLAYWKPDGSQGRADFEVVEVLRDGHPEQWFTKESSGGGVRVYIGQEDVFVSYGRHEYRLTYRIAGQVRQAEGVRRLLWHATGSWGFAIERAGATVVLPRGATVLEGLAYTGSERARGTDWRWLLDGAGNRVFETTRTLPPGQGLTITLSWRDSL